MTIDPDVLSAFAAAYAARMTSIRGRRVQRLIRREFAGADHVLPVRTREGAPAVLGLSASGAALCATDGTGRQAAVLKWRHDGTEALEVRFDLYKDSLPVLESETLSPAALRARARLHGSPASVPTAARPWVAKVLRVLG